MTSNPDGSLSLPGTVIFLDTETTAVPDRANPRHGRHVLRLGVAIAGQIEGDRLTRRKLIRFRTGKEFWDWVNFVRHPRQPVWLFAHNLGFDLTITGFWKLLESKEYTLHKRGRTDLECIKSESLRRHLGKTKKGLIVTEDPPTIVFCWHRHGFRLMCLDSRNYFDMPLSALGNLVGIRKLTMPEQCDADETWFEYCQRDAEILESSMVSLIGWHRAQGIGRFGCSISGMALAAWSTKYGTHQITTPGCQDDRDFERRAYYGGRVESFGVGTYTEWGWNPPPGVQDYANLFDRPPSGPFHLIDSRSFYGAVQAFTDVPVKCIEQGGKHAPASAGPGAIGGDCIAEVLIQSESERFPVRHGDRTYHASGQFWTVLAGAELERAIRTDSVAKVSQWRRYALETAFQAFSLGLHDARTQAEQNDNRLIATVCKQMLARLHGKFLQKTGQWVDCPDLIAPEPWAFWQEIHTSPESVINYRSIGWDVQRQDVPEDTRQCFPAIAAFITAAGREWLRHWMQIAGIDEVLYCSTDAMIVGHSGAKRLERKGMLSPESLGGLRIVHTAETLELRGKNSYRLGDRLCFGGRSKRAIEICGDKYQAIQFQRLAQIIASQGRDSVTCERAEKELPAWSPGQPVGRGGWLLRPHLLMDKLTWSEKL